MAECIFCAIVADPSASHIVWDDDLCVAFLDINPVTTGHCLVVPKEHTSGLDDIAADTAGRIMNVAQELGAAMKRSDLACEGVNLLFADGEAAFQEIFHSHLHVFPRYAGDGFAIEARWEGSQPEQLGAAAVCLRAALPS